MGLFDKIKDFFSGSPKGQDLEEMLGGTYGNASERHNLAVEISNMVLKISLQNSFDPSIRDLRNVSIYTLEQKSLKELTEIHDRLTDRVEQMNKERNEARAIEEAKWNGKVPKGYTRADVDRWQRSDDMYR